MILTFVKQKGGVGSTTTAINLAAALADLGHRVLIVDLDPQANISTFCNIRALESVFDALVNPGEVPFQNIIVETPMNGVFLAPGHLAMAGLESALRDQLGRELLLQEVLVPVAARYDFVICDNAPQLGFATGMSLIAADVAIVPVQCEPLALEGFGQVARTIEMARKRFNPKLQRRVVMTMLDNRVSHSQPMVDSTRKNFGAEVFSAVVPESADLARALLHKSVGATILNYAPGTPAVGTFRDLAKEVAAMKTGALSEVIYGGQ